MSECERGSASLEFLVASAALFVPLVALTVTMTEIGSATFAATAVARHGVRAFVQSPSDAAGLRQVHAMSGVVLDDHGVNGNVSLDVDCSGRTCHQRGSLVTISVSIDLPLRFIPALPGIDLEPSVTITRSATARVSVTSVTR